MLRLPGCDSDRSGTTHLLGPVAGVRHNIPNTKANKEHQGGRREEGGEVQTDVVRVVTKSLRRSNSLLPA